MMKINYRIFTLLAVASLMFTSCDEGDAVVDSVTSNTSRGAILRTINIVSNELPIGVADGFFGVDLEIQSENDGKLVSSVDVYASFRDNTPDNGKGETTPESMVENIATTGFEIGEFGLPRFSYEVTLPTLLSATGVPESDIDGGDQFRVRFELVLTDGRRFSFDQNSGTLTGSYFSSPFLYSATIVCPPTPPTPGTWVFSTTDAFGDSWNGASLDVSLDGGARTSITNIDDGTRPYASNTQIYDFEVPVGTETISIVFTSGSFDGEVAFTITSASGNVVASQEAYSAADPVEGVELINYCIKNF
jgi:hypothetical protein